MVEWISFTDSAVFAGIEREIIAKKEASLEEVLQGSVALRQALYGPQAAREEGGCPRGPR
jgi:hypothetical protein